MTIAINDPVLIKQRLGRLVGYGNTKEGEEFCYIKELDGSITTHYMTELIVGLGPLKGVNKRITTDGRVWDDYTRIDLILESFGCQSLDRSSEPIYDTDFPETEF